MRSFFSHPPILADLIIPTDITRDFSYCFKIINLEDYSNYSFFFTIKTPNNSHDNQGYIPIKANQCMDLEGYRPSATIWAIPKDQLTSNDVTQHQEQLIEAKPAIARPYTLPLNYRGQQVQDSFKIQSLEQDSFTLSMSSRSANLSNMMIVNWSLFPILGLGILWFVWRQIKKRLT